MTRETPLILVIEDETDLRGIISNILRSKGYAVEQAADGLEGIDKARALSPDLILCDVLMPKADGHEVLRTLRADATWTQAPFLFISARSDHQDLRTGMNLGADDYLPKPFGVADLLSMVQARLGRRAARRKAEGSPTINISGALPPRLQDTMANVLGLAELLGSNWRDMEPSEVDELSQALLGATRKVNGMVENAFWLSRVQATLTDREAIERLRSQRTEDAGLIVGITARDRCERAGRRADLSLELDDVACTLGATDLQKVVAELVDNALEATQPGSPVVVRARGHQGGVVIEVQDQGPGASLASAGLGLGLCVCLAQLVGGRLDVQQRESGGSLVAVTLPAPPSAALRAV